MATRTDDFNRANGSPGSNWTAYANASDWTIASNALVFAPPFGRSNNAALRWTGAAMDSNDYTVTVTTTKTSDDYNGPGPAARLQSGALSGYGGQAYADAYYLVRVTGGTEVGLGTYGNPGASVGETSVECEGTTIRLFVAGVQRISVTDTNYSSGSPGLLVGNYDNSDVTFDNWSAEDLGAAAIVGTLSATTAAATLSSTATLAIEATLSATTEAATLSATGSIASPEITGTLSATTADATLSSTATLAIDATLSATTDAATLSATGSAQNTGSVTVTTDDAFLGQAQYGLRFYGTGSDNIDRVAIPLESGATPTAIDVGGDFTYEFWLTALYADNTSSSITDARNSNIFLDRDIWGDPLGYVAGVTRRTGPILAVCFGVAGAGGTWTTIYGTTDVGDGDRHHVAIVRRQSTGAVEIYVDGSLDASGTYTTGSLAFADSGGGGGSPIGMDPYLVLGAEKHDAGASYPSFSGVLDDFRVSNSRRYTGTFTPPTSLSVDGNTVALYLMDTGTGTVLVDAAGNIDGELYVGGADNGPTWELISSAGAQGTLSITSSASLTTADATLSSTATLAIEATLAATTDNSTLSSSASLPVSGSLEATTADATLSAEGGSQNSGVLEVTTADATLSSTATLAIGATLAATTDDSTLSSAASLPVSGSLEATTDDATLSATGISLVGGSLTATTDDATLSATAMLAIGATLAATTDDSTLSSAASLPVSGSLEATTDDATLSSTAALAIGATLEATTDNATLSAIGASGHSGSVVATTDDATISAVGVLSIVAQAAITTEDAVVSSQATLEILGELTVTLEDAVVASLGELGSLPSGTLSATTDDATLSAAGILSIVGQLASTLDSATVSSVASLSIGATASLTTAAATLSSLGASVVPEFITGSVVGPANNGTTVGMDAVGTVISF